MREKERDVHWVHNSISYVYFINMILKRFYYFRNFPSKMYDWAHKKVKWDSVMHAIYVDRLHLSSFLHILLFCIVTSVLLIRVCCWCWKWSKCRCKLWVYVFHITISNEKKKTPSKSKVTKCNMTKNKQFFPDNFQTAWNFVQSKLQPFKVD